MATASGLHAGADIPLETEVPSCSSMAEFKEVLLQTMQKLGTLDGESSEIEVSHGFPPWLQ